MTDSRNLKLNLMNYKVSVDLHKGEQLVEFLSRVKRELQIEQNVMISHNDKEIVSNKEFLEILDQGNDQLTLEVKDFEEFFDKINIEESMLDIGDKKKQKNNQNSKEQDNQNKSQKDSEKLHELLGNISKNINTYNQFQIRDINMILLKFTSENANSKYGDYLQKLSKLNWDYSEILQVYLEALLETPVDDVTLDLNKTIYVPIIIRNVGRFPILGISIQIDGDTKDFVIKQPDLETIFPGKSLNIGFELTLKNSSNAEKKVIVISLKCPGVPIKSNTLKVDCFVNLSNKPKVEEKPQQPKKENNPYREFIEKNTKNDKILDLPADKQKKLVDIMQDELSANSMESIYIALDKHNWDINAAMNDLLD